MTHQNRPTALVRTLRPASGRTRLVCLPYAGGGSQAYASWARLLPTTVDTQTLRLPGRETRFAEDPPRDLRATAAELAAEVAPHLGPDLVIFGHSMGALLAFELVRELRRTAGWEPSALLVSGMRAPRLAGTAPTYGDLSDADLEDAVRRMYGGEPEVLRERDLWELMLPILRADLLICDRYDYREEEPLSCPIVAYGALGDEDVNEDLLAAWGEQTTGECERRMFPGEHFYFDRWPEAFALDLNARLARLAASRTT